MPLEFRFDGKKKEIRAQCKSPQIDETLPVSDDDLRNFARWESTYRKSQGKGKAPETHLQIGREMYQWLDRDVSVLSTVRELDDGTPLRVEFAVGPRPNAAEKTFLQAPWELLADKTGHLALLDKTLFCPVRRVGKRQEPMPPSDFRPGVVFMAASPTGEADLEYEAEEAAMVEATGRIGLDLVPEESGTLRYLAELVAREQPDILHLSCHGRADKTPQLAFEDEFGDRALTDATTLARELGGNRPRVLFLSACESAVGNDVVDSFAIDMLVRQMPAVVGWDGPVGDVEATLYAAAFYKHLAQRLSLTEAVARARLDLVVAMEERNVAARGWHLARLYLGPAGGGVISRGDRARQRKDTKYAYDAFLDTEGKVKVAGPGEFVGRRREIQKVMRAFRERTHKHVAVIRGVGQQGKSSLAARVADRLKHSHDRVVLFGEYDAPAIRRKINTVTGRADVREVFGRHAAAIEKDEANLEHALRDVFETCCKEPVKEDGKTTQRSLLIVVDDFEQALDEQPGAAHKVKPEYLKAMRALVTAVQNADSDVYLLFTTRFEFTLRHDGQDLVAAMFDLPLRPMEGHEAHKQTRAVERVRGAKIEDARRERIIHLARGNPGLSKRLCDTALEDAAACDRALDELKKYDGNPDHLSDEKLIEFMNKIALQTVVDWLSDAEREALRLSTAFGMPVPREILHLVVEKAGCGEAAKVTKRLTGFGLWEVYDDFVARDQPALLINALAQKYVGNVTEADYETIAEWVVPRLFDLWGGEDRKKRPYAADFELTRLALAAQQAAVLNVVARDAVLACREQFQYELGASLGRQAVEVLQSKSITPPVFLLVITAELLRQLGDVDTARGFLDNAVKQVDDGAVGDPEEAAFAFLELGEDLTARGELDVALELYRKAENLLARPDFVRERAVTLGRIADILYQRGELDEALRIRQEEELPVYDKLRDAQAALVCKAEIAINLLGRNRQGDAAEAAALLEAAYADAARLRLPETGQIRQIQKQLGLDVR